MFKGKYTQKLPPELKNLFTARRYTRKRINDEGVEIDLTWSQRLFMSKEMVYSEDRRRLPVLMVNLDGVMGYLDDTAKMYYVLRPKIVESLIQLSNDFRIIAFSSMRAKVISKIIQALIHISPSSETQLAGDCS